MRKIYLIILVMGFNLSSYSQVQEFIFSHLGEKNGLSDNIINCFLRDSRGIVWVGTYNGFNRFDGSNFYAYKKRKGTNSMFNEVVHSLCEDKNGNIWGGTDRGIFCYNPTEDRFFNYDAKSNGTATNFYNIVCDNNGTIWAGGIWSVLKFNTRTKQFDEVIKLTDHKDSVDYFRIRKNGLQQDPSGKALWIATRSGLFYYDIQKNELSNYTNRPADSLFARKSACALAKSPAGNFWFFDDINREIISFDPATKKVIRTINISTILPNAKGATLFQDNNNLLWFSSWTYDILVIDLVTGKIQSLKKTDGDDRSIAANFFWAAFQDNDGTDWLGTVAGISRCNPQKSIYKSFHLTDKIPVLKTTSIQIAAEDPADKSFWLVTKSSFVIHYSQQNDKYETYDLSKASPTADGNKPGDINTIRFFKNTVILTTTTGAWQIEKGKSSIAPFRFLPAGFTSFKCIEMAVDGDSAVYFNDGQRLLYWNYLSGRTMLYEAAANKSETNSLPLSNLFLPTGGKPWMSSTEGRIVMVGANNQLIPVKITGPESRNYSYFSSLDIDAQGKIWLDNKSVGLYAYNPVAKTSRYWDETDGLVSSRIHKIKLDREGRVWSVIYNKIAVLIPGADKFYNFQIPYSENKLDYYNHLSLRSSGTIICTINNELFEFFPDRLETKPGNGKPQLSQLTVAGKDYPVINIDKLVLQSNQNTIRFRFGLLVDKEIFPYEIEYMLQGAETSWTKVAVNNEALYNNLAPGNYTFRVKAKGTNNAWETEESVFNITIKTPFYRTKWFLILVIGLIAAMLYFIYRYRLAQKGKLMELENKAQLLEKEKVMVMYESLKQQLNPHFLFNSLTSLSGLIETDQQVAGNFLEQMSGIYRYILKNGDQETVLIKDEIEFVQLYINLQQTRFKKGLIVNINVPEEYHHYKIAPVTLQNLIENAIKHNIIDTGSPLVIDIFIDGDYIVVKNNLQRKNVVETSNKKGLEQFISLYHYLSELPVVIEETNTLFQIKIPLI